MGEASDHLQILQKSESADSFFDFKEKFKPCSGFLNHKYGDFLILIRVIVVHPIW